MTWLGWYSHEYGAITAAALSFLTGAAAVTTAIFSYKLTKKVSTTQLQVQKRQIRKDFFSLRYQVYVDLKNVIDDAIHLRPSGEDDVVERFESVKERSSFLFQRDVGEYIQHVEQAFCGLMSLYGKTQHLAEFGQIGVNQGGITGMVYESTSELKAAKATLRGALDERDSHFGNYLKIADDFASSVPADHV